MMMTSLLSVVFVNIKLYSSTAASEEPNLSSIFA